MRVLAAILTLLLSASACALPEPVDAPARAHRTLRAYITPPDFRGGPGFHVSRPAYVALFEIVPGRGASLLYPAPGMGRSDGFVFSGLHEAHWTGRRDRDLYLPALGGAGMQGPRFYFMIASERPLNVERFGGFGMGLRGAMGMHFASRSPYDAMERLAELTLPTLADDGSWTTDMYVHWPQALWDSPRAGGILLTCGGYRMYVPREYYRSAREMLCARSGERNPEGGTPAPRDTSATADSGRVAVPQRRAPLPKAGESDLRERITSSTQLEEPARRRPTERRSLDELRRSRRVESERGERTRPGVEKRATDSRRPAPRATSQPRSTERRPAPTATRRPEARAPAPTPPTPRPRPSTDGEERRPACDPCERS